MPSVKEVLEKPYLLAKISDSVVLGWEFEWKKKRMSCEQQKFQACSIDGFEIMNLYYLMGPEINVNACFRLELWKEIILLN